jgi:hypothetical protein
MGDIYKFAYVTISTSQASTGKTGCFAEHQPLEARLTPKPPPRDNFLFFSGKLQIHRPQANKTGRAFKRSD